MKILIVRAQLRARTDGSRQIHRGDGGALASARSRGAGRVRAALLSGVARRRRLSRVALSREQRDGVRVMRVPLWVPARPTGVKRMLHLASFALELVAGARRAGAVAPRCGDDDRADSDVRAGALAARAPERCECVAAHSGLRGRCGFRSGPAERLARAAFRACGRKHAAAALRRRRRFSPQDGARAVVEGRRSAQDGSVCPTGSIHALSFRCAHASHYRHLLGLSAGRAEGGAVRGQHGRETGPRNRSPRRRSRLARRHDITFVFCGSGAAKASSNSAARVCRTAFLFRCNRRSA